MQWVADPDPIRSLTNCLPSPAPQQSMGGNDCLSQEQTHHDDLVSDLPSVVDETAQSANDHDLSIDIFKHLSPNAVRKLQAMNSEVDAFNPTQRISQSFYDSLLRKTKNTQQDPRDEHSTSQRTYEEGDDGHVDITSSFVTRQEPPDDLADSEPVDFSPVQSQHRLTQFPESQRFKTPATAGKKRTYTGDVVETPAPTRNPLVWEEHSKTSNSILGLSQAFAATQAASSPFSNGLPTGPRSDRPSPNIDVQLQPTTTSSSSPLLRPMIELQRAATEPAARYVSMKHSQAERERQERSHISKAADEVDDLDDGFGEEDSVVARKRRQRAREEKAKQEFKSLSSPLLPPQDYSNTSPLKSIRRDPSEGQIPDLSTASPTVTDDMDLDDVMAVLSSEEETEREDDKPIDVAQSSQARKYTEENKENNSVLVPKTGPRNRSHIEQEIAQIDASPSLRHSTTKSIVSLSADMHSSEPFRVMDSQPSQSRSKSVGSGRVYTNTTSDIIDFVEYSPHPNTSKMTDSIVLPENEHGPNTKSNAGKGKFRWPEDQVETSIQDSGLTTNTTHRDTIPETNSDVRAGGLNKTHTIHQHSTNKDGSIATGNDFETAPTHVDQVTTLQSSQISSPIRTTPPGRKRRRLLEISAEPSPHKSQSQLSFDAGAVLQLDEDAETADLLESSPRRSPLARHISAKNNVTTELPAIFVSEQETSDPSANESIASGQSQDPSVDGTKLTPETSQEIVGPGRQGRILHSSGEMVEQPNSSPALPIITRASIFDIQASPEKPAGVKLHLKIPNVGSSKTKQKKAKNDQSRSRMDRRLQTDEPGRSVSNNMTNHHNGFDRRAADQSNVLDVRVSNGDHEAQADEVVASHMVLAYYRGDPRGYYPAKLLGRTSSSGYTIQWEGYEPDEVDAYGVKALDLRIGDAIKILADGFQKVPYVIMGFKDKTDDVQNTVTDIRGYQTLTVSQKRRRSKPVSASTESSCDISIASIYLDVNMWAQMKLRNQDFTPLIASNPTTGLVTPLDRASSPATPSMKGRRQLLSTVLTSTPIMHGMFVNMAFAISYDDSTQRNMCDAHVQANGGMVIHDSFHDLLEPGKIQLKAPYANVGFTALLTDRHSRKEKYMQALALGLPCLSGKWIEACVKQGKLVDWHSYLLPAGESAELDNATRSRFLPPIDMMSSKLSALLDSRPNLLEDARVIVVVGRGKAEAKRSPYLFLVQAIGASQINRVPDIESARELLSSDEGSRCSWIFVDDRDVKTMRNLLDEGNKNKQTKARTKARGHAGESRNRCTVAGNELIVQSLILGRLYESH